MKRRASLKAPRSLHESAELLARGSIGANGGVMNQLSAEELRVEMDERGHPVKNGTKNITKVVLEKVLKRELKGLTCLHYGFGGLDVSAYGPDGYLEHLEVGFDPMHGIKGLFNSVFPILAKKLPVSYF